MIERTDIGRSGCRAVAAAVTLRHARIAAVEDAGGEGDHHGVPIARRDQSRLGASSRDPRVAGEAALRTRLAQIEARMAAVQAVQAVQQAQAPLPLAAREVFSYSLSLMEAERQWLATRVQVPGDEQN